MQRRAIDASPAIVGGDGLPAAIGENDFQLQLDRRRSSPRRGMPVPFIGFSQRIPAATKLDADGIRALAQRLRNVQCAIEHALVVCGDAVRNGRVERFAIQTQFWEAARGYMDASRLYLR